MPYAHRSPKEPSVASICYLYASSVRDTKCPSELMDHKLPGGSSLAREIDGSDAIDYGACGGTAASVYAEGHVTDKLDMVIASNKRGLRAIITLNS